MNRINIQPLCCSSKSTMLQDMLTPITKIALIILILGASCNKHSDKRIDIRPFYYPIKQLDSGMMFVYMTNDESMPLNYWHLQSDFRQDSTFLSMKELDPHMRKNQALTELVLSNGSQIVHYDLVERDTLGHEQTLSLSIQSADRYPFYVQENGGIYLFQAKWAFPSNPGLKYTLVRNRRYAGDTTFAFQGKEIRAIRFSVKELIETEDVGFQELRFDKMELYGEGLGLVYTETYINDSIRLYSKLTDTFSVADFESRYQVKIDLD